MDSQYIPAKGGQGHWLFYNGGPNRQIKYLNYLFYSIVEVLN